MKKTEIRTKVARTKAPRLKPAPALPPEVARTAKPADDSEGDVRLAIDIALDKKALQPVVLDVRNQTSYTDYIAIVSGNSDRQVQTIADAIVDGMKAQGRRAIGLESGGPQNTWALIDFGDFVIHVFYHQTREFYDLESMLSDAPRLHVDVPPEQRYVSEPY